MRVSDARPSFLRWTAIGMGVAVASTGAGHLAAWFAGVMAERGVSGLTMKTNAALCLLLLGTSLLLLVPQTAGAVRSWASRACAGLALLIGALSLSENVAGWDLGIDQLLAQEPPGALGVSGPNRMGTPASVSFMLAGAALLLLAKGHGRGAWAARKLAGAICLIALLSIIGYLYGVQTLYGVARFTGIAWPTAAMLLLLGLGILCARPDQGLAAQLVAPDVGGATLRWLLLPMVLMPVGLGWLRLAGERWGWFDAGMGTSLTMLIFIVTFTSLACLAVRRGSKAAMALRESERRFRVAQELSLDAFTILSALRDTDGRITDFRWEYVNPTAARLLRQTPEDLTGRRLLQVLPGNKANSDLFGHYVRVVETGDAHDYELFYESDGIHGWFRNMAVRLDDGIAVYFADITERKRAEESLRKSQAMLARAQRMAKLGTWEWDVATGELIWSEEVYQIFGRAAGQFTPTFDVYPQLIHPDDRPSVMAAIEGGLAGRAYNIEYRIVRPDSTVRHIVAQGDVDLDAAGRPRRMMGTVLDVTAAKEVEKALRASEARYRILFDEMDEGYCIIEMLYDASGRPNDWRFIEVNPAFEKHNGLKNATGKTIRALVPNIEPRWFERYGEVARTGQAVRFEELSEALDGRWFDLYAFRVGEPAQHRVAVLFTDITARKKAEEERITAHSEGIGRGATFTVRLPVAQCPLSAARNPLASGSNRSQAVDPLHPGNSRLRILLVEDHADTAKIMTKVLAAEGHDVVTAGSVADGLAAVARAKPDVLISDLGLPDGSGLDLIKQLSAQGERIPSIALSGYGTPADVERSKAAGFSEHLVKPLKSIDLLTAAMARLGFFGRKGP